MRDHRRPCRFQGVLRQGEPHFSGLLSWTGFKAGARDSRCCQRENRAPYSLGHSYSGPGALGGRNSRYNPDPGLPQPTNRSPDSSGAYRTGSKYQERAVSGAGGLTGTRSRKSSAPGTTTSSSRSADQASDTGTSLRTCDLYRV